jgi:Mannosyl-glycoprotein endo-beta-N-acetylglucosaminidase
LGMRDDIKCLWGVTKSVVADPRIMIGKVAGCAAKFADTKRPSTPAPGGPSEPGKGSCCEKALKDSLRTFLEAQDQALLAWDPSLVDDLVSAGKSETGTGVDPRLMAAIATVESGHGKGFKPESNNPFGLGPGASYPSPARGISVESQTLKRDIYIWGQSTVDLLYAGHGYICSNKRCWPQDVLQYPAYCSHSDCSPKPVKDFLLSMPGDAANGLSPGNPTDLRYPCN